MDIVDIKTYMQAVGREARSASRMMARVETASKNQALTTIAAAIRRNKNKLLAANTTDLVAAEIKGFDSALIDRLTLTPKGIANMVEGLLQIAALADPIGEISDPSWKNASAVRSSWHYLRSTAQCYGRRCRVVYQSR